MQARYTPGNVFQTDQYMYNLFEQIAKGYRLIPIASSRLKPYTVTQIVSSKQVASFLRLYAFEVRLKLCVIILDDHLNSVLFLFRQIMGKFAVKSIGRSGLLRKAPCVPREANFGTAIVALAESKFECLPVVDDRMRFCGRFDASAIKHFWWSWKVNLARRSGTAITLSGLQHEYSRNNVLIPSGTGLNYSHFSSLLTPLTQCENLGVNLVDFDELTKKSLKVGLSDFARKHGISTNKLPRHGTQDDSDSEEEDDEFDDMMSRKDSDGESDTRSVQSSASSRSLSLSSTRGSTKSLRHGSTAGRGARVSRLPSVAAKKRQEEEEQRKIQKEKEDAMRLEEESEKLKSGIFHRWTVSMGVVVLEDTIQVALEAMHQFSASQAFVVDSKCELIGMITLEDIAKTLINEESTYQSAVYQRLVDGVD